MMWKFHNTKLLERKWNDCSGVTLTELIITFALMGIFMTAASFMITSSLQMFTRTRNTANAVMVSNLLLDKITGEISAAILPADGKSGYYFWLEDSTESEWVVFESRSGSPVAMYVSHGRLFVKDYDDLSETDWHFDDMVYMGYQITRLTFSQPEPADHANVIQIDLELSHERTGFVYRTRQYAKNYNFDPATDYIGVRPESGNGMPVEAEEFERISGEDSFGV